MQPFTTLTEDQAHTLTGRARFPHIVEQWEGDGGEARGVWLRALSTLDRMEAELAAVVEVRKGTYEVSEWRRMCEEVARGIVEPPGLTGALVAKWNDAIVQGIHARLNLIAYMAPARINAEVSAAMGGPAPAAPPAARPRRQREPAAPGVGAGDS